MQSEFLSQHAFRVMNGYVELPLPHKKINCPYFNNKRHQVRGGLRVHVGKGTPDDIVEEAIIEALKQKINLNDLNEEQTKKFLVDNNLGVDCSALVYHILTEEVKNKKCHNLANCVTFPEIKNPIRRLIARIRHVENTNVDVLAHPKNSQKININKIKPGDVIFMLETGHDQKLNHVLLVFKTDNFDGQTKKIYYVHSFRWTSEGKYNHGVRKGTIEIIDDSENLLNQKWTENEKENDENETYQHAKMANKLLVKRLNAML